MFAVGFTIEKKSFVINAQYSTLHVGTCDYFLQPVTKIMLDVFEGSWLQSGKPWVQRMGSYPACNRVVNGETPSLEVCLVSPLDMWFSF